MTGIIKGGDISVYKTIAITLGQSKKENRDGVKSKFAIFTVKDEECPFANASRVPIFEEELGVETFERLKKYRMLDETGKPIVDAKGGYPIDIKTLKASDDAEALDWYLRIRGGMVMTYDLGGAYYANDIDGKPTLDAKGNPVIRTSIEVFVIVKNQMPSENGGITTNFFPGFSLSGRGERIKSRFYQKRADTPAITAPTATAAQDEAANNGDPF